MIESFGDRATEDLFHGRNTNRVRRLPNQILNAALNKLDVLNAAHKIQDLREPPSNRLETLKGDLKGFYSIRVNNQWRIIFRWSDSSATHVSLVDYH